MTTKAILGILLTIVYGTTMEAQLNADSLTEELSKLWEKSDLPGFAVSIVTENGSIYKHGFGYADKATKTPFTPETIINVGSVSKTVVGVAIIKAVEDGSLTMDSEINKFLPFQIHNPYHRDIPILIRHLVTHSSTILDTRHYAKSYIPLFEDLETGDSSSLEFLQFIEEHQKISLIEFIENILTPRGKWYKQRNFANDKPGANTRYSNLNAAIAALILQESTFYPFKAYTQKRIFDSLEMNSTGWSVDEIDMSEYATLYFPNGKIVPRYQLITYPDGGLLSNVSDLSKFLREIMIVANGTSGFLNDKYSELLLPGDSDLDRAFWGMGSTGNIGHSGSDPGIQADLQFNKVRKTGRVILCNVNAEESDDLYKQYREIHRILSKYDEILK